MDTVATEGSQRSVSGLRWFLHIDGLAMFAGSIAAYAFVGGRWWLFAALILAPDLFMPGYLTGSRAGAVVYNAGHTMLIPLLLVVVGVIAPVQVLVEIGVIWAAHIGMDHLFGYGFKYPSRFKDTHFGRV
ncbi:MAG: DUF4260 domain-containing protein [Spirochaetia bacterium]